MNINIGIVGLKKIQKDLNSMSPKFKKSLVKAHIKTTMFAKGELQRNTPNVFGIMRAGWEEDLDRVHKLESTIYNSASAGGSPYPLFVEEGTKPRTKLPPIQKIELWAKRAIGSTKHVWAIAYHIMKRGTKPQKIRKKSAPKIEKMGKLLYTKAIKSFKIGK